MKVNFFATLRDIAGGKTVEFDVNHGVTAQELLDKIIERSPVMKKELLDKDGKMYGHVHGTEFKRKGLDGLLEGLALAPRAKFKLLIAGGGGGKLDHYTRLTETMGLGSEVRFLGLVQDIERIYPIADMYVLPTLADPCPLAPLEAMAAGVATIMSASDFNGSAELIRNGEALLLSDPRDPHEIAQALKTLMDSRVRQELAEKGRQVVSQFTWDKTAAETLSAYRDVMRRKRLHRESVGSCRATGI